MDITEDQAPNSTERTRLLGRKGAPRDRTLAISSDVPFNPYSVLPISFLAALGMAATAATSIFAYATILCKDPTHCEGSEQKKYASSVAFAVTIANICSMLVLTSLEKISRTHLRAGLGLWVVFRSMSVVMLGFGVYLKDIKIALSGRLFEGLASDNLLHFTLNSIYVRTATSEVQTSRLIGSSLALFMIGISISPSVAGLFQNLSTSFMMAGAIFASSMLYLAIFVRAREGNFPEEHEALSTSNEIMSIGQASTKRLTSKVIALLLGIFSPLNAFSARPGSLMSGIALLIYASVQSYIFSLIMVHTSLVFGFSGKQNGFLLTLVHATAASYLFVVLFIIPRHVNLRKSQYSSEPDQQKLHHNTNRDAAFAKLSLYMQVFALIGFANATQVWEVYAICAVLALGLAAPSFIKSHFLGYFEKEEGSEAMGAIAMMETGGALISPLLLGTWQSLWPGIGVFYFAAGMMALATGFFTIAAFILEQKLAREERIDNDTI